MNKITMLTAAVSLAIATGSAGVNVAAAQQTPTVLEAAVDLDTPTVTAMSKLDQQVQPLTGELAARTEAIAALEQHFPAAQYRINPVSNVVETLYAIAVETSGETPQQMALNFINEYAVLFPGLAVEQLVFNPHRSKSAMGGQMVRFDQAVDGVKVRHSGIGLVIDGDNRVRAVMADYQPSLNLSTVAPISSELAIAAARSDINGFADNLPAQALEVLQSAYSTINEQLGVFATPQPEKTIVFVRGEPRLAWQFYYYATNPFGVFRYVVDAASGEILERQDQVKRLDGVAATDQYADYFPTFPAITAGMKSDCAIEDDNGGETDKPSGMTRIKLRKFDDSNRTSGSQGNLTGQHALIHNALPTKLPFAQAALGTYYFNEDMAPIKARPNERDHLAEPAEHFDGISQFIYITNLMEYLDYLHKAGDSVHSQGLGSGDFPDSYPNESVPLVGVVHIPNVLAPPQDPAAEDFVQQLMGLDNAFAVPLSQEINGQEVVVNPTFYGHGYLFNNLAIDFSVPMHEGTHATITPIAGFEGEPEGGALNEGQADLWAYTIGETPNLGTYPVNSCDLRRYLQQRNIDPDSFQYIRSAQSQLRYSQLGTRDDQFEVHRDGEIYAGAMWDLRELMLKMYPAEHYSRPDPVTGKATLATSTGKDTWERTFLGSMYILGLTAPDTFVKARDAVLIANAILYPTNPLDVSSVGHHHALIERVFAARELGVNAVAPVAGRQTVSSAVSDFSAGQDGPAVPQNIRAEVISDQEVRVSWDPLDQVIGYQLLKRKAGSPQRLFSGVAGREYYEGDAVFGGYTHVEFITEGNEYHDKGQGYGRGEGQGIDALDYQYVVRAIAVNAAGQVGFSALSGTAKTALKSRDVSDDISSRISNVVIDGARFSFDQVLTNNAEHDIFGPIDFTIVQINNPSVEVVNADNNGSGQGNEGARFRYEQSLSAAETSAPRHIEFVNPQGQMFSFKARVRGYQQTTVRPARGAQQPVDNSAPSTREVVYHALSERQGMVLLGTSDQVLVDGVDYVDVPLTTKDSANGLTATLSVEQQVADAVPDLDFQLLDSAGNVLSTSGNMGADEQVAAAVAGGDDYTLRVIGWANGPTQFKIVIDETVIDPQDATELDGSAVESDGALQTFSFDPLTNTVRLLD